jgi:magnesium-transporting ATPase (P-type)
LCRIKVWVLTGDKTETAVNIGFGCKLLTNDMQLVNISGDDNKKIKSQINALAQQFANVSADYFMQYGLIIEGSALSYCLSDELVSQTLSICMKCGVVICCRVTPIQKFAVNFSLFFFILGLMLWV